MLNNLNTSHIVNDVDYSGPIRFAQEANQHGKKGMQIRNFASKKGNFGKMLVNKLHAKKVLDRLNLDESIEFKTASKF